MVQPDHHDFDGRLLKMRLLLLLGLLAPMRAFPLPLSEICNDCPPEHLPITNLGWFIIALLVVGCYYLSKAILKGIARIFRCRKASAQPRQ